MKYFCSIAFLLVILGFARAAEWTAVASAPIARGKMISAGFAQVVPHSGSAAWAADGKRFKKVQLDIQPFAGQGVLRMEILVFDAASKWAILESGAFRLELSSGALERGMWHRLECRWSSAGSEWRVDGELAGRSALFPRTALTIPGFHGLFRRLELDRPGTMPPAAWMRPVGDKVDTPLKMLANNLRFCEFDFRSPVPVDITVRPRMNVRRGMKFLMDPSDGPVREIIAARDGELTFRRGAAINARIAISPTEGSLLTGFTFSGTDDRLPERRFDFEPKSSFPKLPVPPAQPDIASHVKSRVPGTPAFRLGASRPRRQVCARSSCEVDGGTDYLLSGFYRVERNSWGAGFFTMVIFRDASGRVVVRRAMHSETPLIYGEPGSFLSFEQMVSAPKCADGTRLRADILVTVEGGPSEIVFDQVDFRKYPRATVQGMPDQSDRYKSKRFIRPAIASGKEKFSPPVGYLGYDLGGYRTAAEAGVPIQWTYLKLSDRENPDAVWSGRGRYDFSAVTRRLRQMLDYAPGTRIGLYLEIDPYLDFALDFPDAAWIDARGRRVTRPRPRSNFYPERRGKTYDEISFTAPDFCREAGDMLERLGRYLASIPEGGRIAAVHLRGGGDGQWFYWPGRNDFADRMDRSPGSLAVLREKFSSLYGGDCARLRLAWQEPSVSFATIQFPPAEDFTQGLFRDVRGNPRDRKVADFTRAYAESVIDSISALTLRFEKGLGRNILKSRYYCGAALGYLLDRSDFDMFVSVAPYGECRRPGRIPRLNMPVEAASRRGKIFLDELDLRTEYSAYPARSASGYDRRRLGVVSGGRAFADQLCKMMAPALAGGGGFWLFSIGGDAAYREEYAPAIAEAVRVAAALDKQPPEAPAPVAVYVDERAREAMSPRFGWDVWTLSSWKIAAALNLAGLRWRHELLGDLTRGDGPRPAKLHIFTLAPTVTAGEIAYIQKYLQRDRNVLVFCFDTGRLAPHGFAGTLEKLSGIRGQLRADLTVPGRLGVERFNDPLSRALDDVYFASSSKLPVPLMYVDDPEAVPLALLDGTRLVGAAVKRHRNWTGVYLAVPGGMVFSPGFLRALAREAGLTPDAEAGDSFVGGRSLRMLHAHRAGVKTLYNLHGGRLTDLRGGRVVAEGRETFSFPMKFGETRMFRLDSGTASKR